MYNLTC